MQFVNMAKMLHETLATQEIKSKNQDKVLEKYPKLSILSPSKEIIPPTCNIF